MVKRFKMTGRDVNSSPTQYRTWIVNNQPDFTGSLYTGLKSGANAFVDVAAHIINSDGYIVDFNLPKPKDWQVTKRVVYQDGYSVLDGYSSIANSQLAIVDGYTYLFGGMISKKIHRASLNNPADWVDMTALQRSLAAADGYHPHDGYLPSVLYGSQLAIVDGYIYLFGGNDNHITTDVYSASDRIYSAPTSNPLSWTNHGSKLPKQLQNSQLLMSDGYLYLFGGEDGYEVSDVIYRASTSDPLTWTDTGNKLVDPLCGSQLGYIDGYVYLFGGSNSIHAPSKKVYRASRLDFTSWSLVGNLPQPMSQSQFFTIGTKGYLVGPADLGGVASFTNIFRCELSDPTAWINIMHTIPGSLSQSQVAIIYDRIFLFGGSGETAIFACNQDIQYVFTKQDIIDYGIVTRTEFQANDNVHNPFLTLGFACWKTNYS